MSAERTTERARGGCGPVRASKVGRWRALALILVHVAIAAHLAHWALAGETLTPLEPSEAMETLERGYVNAGFVLFTAAILSTLVLGRFLCGWACHLVALQDLCAWLLGKLGLKPKPVRSRLLVLVPFFAAFYMFAWPSLRRAMAGSSTPAWEAHLSTSDFWATFPGPVVGAITFLVCGFLLVYWMGAKGFCTYGCPYGALFSIADRAAPLRIVVSPSCDGCGHCTAVCSSNVRVHEEVKQHGRIVDPGCMKCFDCVSVCPKEALSYGFAKPALTLRSAQRKLHDFSWGEELLLALGFAAFFLAFRGLYDQVPFLLALGLGALGACGLLLLVRAVSRADLQWQRLRLKEGGRFTRAGRLVGGLALAFLVFGMHCAAVRWSSWRGGELLQEAQATRGAQRTQLIEESRAHLERAASLGLFADARLDFQRGSIAYTRGERVLAEELLLRAVEGNPRQPFAWLGLAEVRIARGALDECEAALQGALRYHPEFAPARERLELLRLRRAAEVEPPR
ncbi:MAG: 4Fe-4S binding protein [Planctomycetes bacterium]|nr:4Fe-4S binding protein [Planctomycetota bacterium]